MPTLVSQIAPLNVLEMISAYALSSELFKFFEVATDDFSVEPPARLFRDHPGTALDRKPDRRVFSQAESG